MPHRTEANGARLRGAFTLELKGYPVTAREMTDSEKQRYVSWKKP